MKATFTTRQVNYIKESMNYIKEYIKDEIKDEITNANKDKFVMDRATFAALLKLIVTLKRFLEDPQHEKAMIDAYTHFLTLYQVSVFIHQLNEGERTLYSVFIHQLNEGERTLYFPQQGKIEGLEQAIEKQNDVLARIKHIIDEAVS